MRAPMNAPIQQWERISPQRRRKYISIEAVFISALGLTGALAISVVCLCLPAVGVSVTGVTAIESALGYTQVRMKPMLVVQEVNKKRLFVTSSSWQRSLTHLLAEESLAE